MPFPFSAIGAGLGIGAQQIQQQQQAAALNALRQLALRQAREQQQADQASFAALLGGGLGGGPQPPMPGQSSLPTQIPQPQQQADSGLAPGFARGPDGLLTRNGRPPDTYIGGQLPGGGAVPAWEDKPSGPTSAPGRLGGMSVPSNFLDTVSQYESGNQNIPQGVLGPQGGYNPSTGTVTGPSTAQGYYQITNTTWRGEAPKAGVDLSQYPTAMSAPREVQKKVAEQILQDQGPGAWTNYNERLRAAVGGLPPPVKQAVQQTTIGTVSQIPSAAYGQMDLPSLAQRVERANPGMPDAVKWLAVQNLQKLLAPQEQRQFEVLMQTHREEFQEKLRLLTQQHSDERQDRTFAQQKELERMRESKGGGQLYTDPKTGTAYQISPSGDARPVKGLPEGAVKVGANSQAAVPPEARKALAEGIANYQLPPLAGWALKSPNGQQVMADVLKINPEYDATTFTGKQSGARAVGTRSATLGMAANVAEEMIPLVEATSRRIDRTQFPSINAMELAVEKGTGSEDVVRFMEQINTLRYVYARALNPTGTARVEDLKRLDNIIDPAWSKGQISAGLDQMRQSIAAERRGIDRTLGKRPAAASAPTSPAKYEIGQTVPGPDGKQYTIKSLTPDGQPDDVEPAQ